jgi:hypothetical protein
MVVTIAAQSPARPDSAEANEPSMAACSLSLEFDTTAPQGRG